jgi:hypothetical protein
MRLRLGGWQRIWIILAGGYLAVVAVFTWSSWPNALQVLHDHGFYDGIPTDPRERILNTQVQADREFAFVLDARSAKDAVVVDMPNGHALVFHKDLPQPLMESAASAYWSQVERATYEKRLSFAAFALGLWALPLMLIYALGLAVRWTYRGFREDGSDPG